MFEVRVWCVYMLRHRGRAVVLLCYLQLNTVAVDFATTGIKLLDHVIKTGEDALTCEAVLQKCAKDVVAVVRAAVKDKGPHSQVVKTQGLQCCKDLVGCYSGFTRFLKWQS